MEDDSWTRGNIVVATPQQNSDHQAMIGPNEKNPLLGYLDPDMDFVQNFTPPNFQAKNFTPSISPNFNSFSKKKHKK